MGSKYACFIMVLAVLAGCIQVSSVELIGVLRGFPQLVYDDGDTTYDASADLLSIEALPIAIRFSAGLPPRFLDPAGDPATRVISIRVEVDDTGMLIGGVAGDDLVVEGEVDEDGDGSVDFSGVLLTGEVAEFGFEDSGGSTDFFDFRFTLTGGSLAPTYFGQDIGVFLTSEQSDFTGDFTVDFSGEAKGNVGPTEPIGGECDLQVIKTCLIPTPPSSDNDCQGKVVSMTFVYTGESCDVTTNDQSGKVECSGDPNGAEPVRIVITGDENAATVTPDDESIAVADLVTIAATGEKLKNDTRFDIRQGVTVLQSLKIHTSCSKPLNVGDQFGSMRLVELTTTEGGTVGLPDPPEELPSECEITSPPPPHCQGKVRVLSLRYIGGDCFVSNDQEGQAECSGDADMNEPVRLVITRKPEKVTVTPSDESVHLGDVVTLTALGSNLEANTEFDIRQGATVLQSLKIHTSCSKELNLGDLFGSVEVVGLDTTGAGLALLGAEVEYLYTIENTGTVDVFDIIVEDDILGPVPGSPIALLAPGATVTLTASTFVEEDVTNSVTVVGNAGDCQATATASVTFVEPPSAPAACTTKVQAMLLEYTGTEILGATVEFIADKFSGDPLVYTEVDLVSGAILSSPNENGWTIDAIAHGKNELGAKTRVKINGILQEIIHTSCSTPFAAQEPAPLDNHDPGNPPKGTPSLNWFVLDFLQK